MDRSTLKAWLTARLHINSERGATMVEYVLILALIAILVIAIVTAFGRSASNQ